MAFEYKYARKYSTEEMVAKAYKEYTASVAEKYALLVDTVQTTIDSVDADTNVDNLVEDMIGEMGEDYSADTNLPLNGGIVKLGDFLKSIATDFKQDQIAIDSDTLRDYAADFTLMTKDGEALVTNSVNILSELKATLHSVVTENAVATAYATASTVAERLSVVRDVISEKFANAFTDLSGSLNEATTRIKAKLNIVEYIKDKMATSGIDDAAESGSSIATSHDCTFTGASPATGYAWATAPNMIIGAAQTAVKVVYKAVKTVISGIFNLAKRIFKKVASKIYETVINPKDLSRINGEKGNNTINGYYTRFTEWVNRNDAFYKYIIDGPFQFEMITGEVIIQKQDVILPTTPFTDMTTAFTQVALLYGRTLDVSHGLLNGVQAVWPEFDGDNLYAFADWLSGSEQVDDSIIGCLNYLVEHWFELAPGVAVDVLVKPKCVNYKLLGITGTTPIGDITYYKVSDIITVLDNWSVMSDMYLDIDASEEDLYHGFAAGCWWTILLFRLLALESSGVDLDTHPNVTLQTRISWYVMTHNWRYSNITNKDFFDLATNFIVKFDEHDPGYDPQDPDAGMLDARDLPVDILSILNNVLHYRDEHPYDYGFWPYARNAVTWFDSSYEIKTDAENERAFANFVTTAIVVAIVVFVGIKIFNRMKKRAYNRYAKATGMEWNIATRLSDPNGDLATEYGAVSLRELKKLKKAKKKANKTAWLTGALQGDSGSSSFMSSMLSGGDAGVTSNYEVISLLK